MSHLGEQIVVVPCVEVAAVVVLELELAVLLDVELLFDVLSAASSSVCDDRDVRAVWLMVSELGLEPGLPICLCLVADYGVNGVVLVLEHARPAEALLGRVLALFDQLGPS